MSSLGRSLGVLGVMFAVLLLGPSASAYGQDLQDCFDQAETHNGEPPTCTGVEGDWEASWPDDGFGAGAFGGILALGVFIGIGTVVWKVSTARRIANQSGMDPNLATEMTLLSDNGLDATYLSANLRNSAEAPAVPATATSAKRLEELKGLLDSNLITQEEYDKRRTAIIEAV